MTTVVQTVTAGSQFDGTWLKGLFDFAPDNVGLGCKIDSIMFHTSASCSFTLVCQDPDTAGNAPVILSGSGADLYFDGMLLPATSTGNHWALKFSTSGMANNGYLTITYTQVTRGRL